MLRRREGEGGTGEGGGEEKRERKGEEGRRRWRGRQVVCIRGCAVHYLLAFPVVGATRG